jgi:hypothetical protein
MPPDSHVGPLVQPRPVQLLREDRVALGTHRPTYEDEGSDQVSRGSVSLPAGGRWSAMLEVRMGSEQGALLTVHRSGAGAGPAPSEASLVIPPGEEEAFLTLVTGLVAQGRRHGVLSPAPEGKSRRRVRPRPTPPDPIGSPG